MSTHSASSSKSNYLRVGFIKNIACPICLLLWLTGCSINTGGKNKLDDPDYYPGSELICYDQHLLSCRDPNIRLEKIAKLELRMSQPVVEQIYHYLGRDPEHITVSRKNTRLHIAEMIGIFQFYRLPVDLLNIVVVESKGIHHAKSGMGARGPWQFMKPTAKSLGLKVNLIRDDRTNYKYSTIAAAKYLRKMHKRFGDWDWVLAAYNAGPTKADRIRRDSRNKNFWSSAHKFPLQTQQFVAKIIAVSILKESDIELRRYQEPELTRVVRSLKTQYR